MLIICPVGNDGVLTKVFQLD